MVSGEEENKRSAVSENQKNFLRCLTHLLSLADNLFFNELVL